MSKQFSPRSTGTIAVILCLFMNCEKTEKEIEREHIVQAIEILKLNDQTKWIVILPGLGCHGCIQTAEAFMEENIENDKVFFVLTRLSSLKVLQQKLGIQLKDYENVYVDREDLFVLPTKNDNYPCIVKLDDHRIEMHMFQSPENDKAFDKMKEQLVATN